MKKKKVLIVAHHLTIGGVQKSLISALKALDYDKYDVTLYLRKNRTELISYVDKRVKLIINTDPNHYYRKPYAISLQLQELIYKITDNKEKQEKAKTELAEKIIADSMQYEHRAYFKDSHYDIAVAYVQGYEALFVRQHINADRKIVFFHTSTDDHHELHEQILPDFDCIAALHDEQKELLKKWYPDILPEIRIVGNYTDKDFVTEQSKAFSVEKNNQLTLCSCGRFANVKGFDLATEAAEILKNYGLDFCWYFVGDGPERSRIEKMISEKSLDDRIIITGMQKNPYPYMLNSDMYVQPSYEEASPMTISEVLKLSRPVITTATVGGKKLVDDKKNGIVCDINAQAIAEAVMTLVNDKNLRDYIITNLKSKDFSSELELFKDQWKNILEE